jgi:hypothetical protein
MSRQAVASSASVVAVAFEGVMLARLRTGTSLIDVGR